MLTLLLILFLFAPQAPAKDSTSYTIETKLARIKATELVPAAGKRAGVPAMGPRAQPPMSFKVGEEVKIAIEEIKARSNRKPDLYILDSKRKEHVLAIEEITSKDQADR